MGHTVCRAGAPMTRLPPTFTSLYRLFLRTTSAAVQQQSAGSRNLRKLWKPVFQTAARAVKRLDDRPQSDDAEQQQVRMWLDAWERRSKAQS